MVGTPTGSSRVFIEETLHPTALPLPGSWYGSERGRVSHSPEGGRQGRVTYLRNRGT